jgi:hypothetical protein
MADMDIFEFAAMVEETPVRSALIEYHAPDGDLRAVCLTDLLDDGLSMVYSFFDPSRPRDSLGTYIILDHVRIARELSLPYVYPGLLGARQRQDGLQGPLRRARGLQARPVAAPRATRPHTALPDTHPLSVRAPSPSRSPASASPPPAATGPEPVRLEARRPYRPDYDAGLGSSWTARLRLLSAGIRRTGGVGAG